MLWEPRDSLNGLITDLRRERGEQEARRMGMTLDQLIDIARIGARENPPSAQEMEAQRRSFAYGTAHIENEAVTRDMIDHEADRFNQS